MNKPSWDDSPIWANYLAQDYDGSWTWFENKPSTNRHLNYWFRTGDNMMQRAYTQVDLWKETLEERPKAQKEYALICDDCDHLEGDNFESFCALKNKRKIDNVMACPEWCPLPLEITL